MLSEILIIVGFSACCIVLALCVDKLRKRTETLELQQKLLAAHLTDVIIRISALEGKSEDGTVKSRLDNLTIRVEQIEKGEG